MRVHPAPTRQRPKPGKAPKEGGQGRGRSAVEEDVQEDKEEGVWLLSLGGQLKRDLPGIAVERGRLAHAAGAAGAPALSAGRAQDSRTVSVAALRPCRTGAAQRAQ